MSVGQHLNEFNTITTQLSSVDIEFDDKIRALIILASLSYSWKAISMTLSNSGGRMKLEYDDICVIIPAKGVYKKDFGKYFGLSMVLSVDD